MKKNILSKRLLSLCVSLLMVLSPVVNSGTSLFARAESADLAREKMVYVNGQFGDESGDKAVDGDDATKWCNISSRVNWLIVDLGEETAFDTWVLKSASAGGESWAYNTRDFHVQVSNDANAWQTVSTVLGQGGYEGADGILCGKLAEPVSARYVRLYISYGSFFFDTQVRVYGFELYNGDYSTDAWAEQFGGEKNTLSLESTSAALSPGAELELTSLISASKEGEITWSTRENDIISLDCLTGKATGLKEGTAHVTATATEGGSTANFDVVVNQTGDLPDPPVPVDPVDLAKGKTVSVNGQFGDESGDKAVDGDDATKWCNISSRVNWLIVDLGEETAFDTWVLKSASAGGESWAYNTRDFHVQVSNDANAWQTVSTVLGQGGYEGADGILCGKLAEPVSARYVRLYISYGSFFFDTQVRVYGFELYNGDYSTDAWAEQFGGEKNTLSLESTSAALSPGAELELTSLISASKEGEITWSTRENDIISLDCLTGKATGLKEGTAHVTATATEGGSTANFDVVVNQTGDLPDPPVPVDPVDLAKGKTVSVNGQASDGESGDKAVDGDDTTKWCYTASRVNWLIVDLGEETAFDTWVLKSASAGGESWAYNTRDFHIQVSNDANAWQTVSTVLGQGGYEGADGILCGKLAEPVSARYVRLYISYGSFFFDTQVRVYGFELYNGDYSTDAWVSEFNGEENLLSYHGGTITVEQNESVSLAEKITASDSSEVTWSVRESEILQVNPMTGNATGLQAGVAHVTATATNGGSTVNFEVTVKEAEIGGDAEDIALGKTAYASGMTNENESAEFAVDGNDATKWCDNTENTVKWMVVDLGDSMEFDTWVLKNSGYGGEPGAYNPKSVYIQTSEDGIVWNHVDCVTNVSSDIIERRMSEPVRAQYVRLYMPEPSQFDHVARVYGFELYNGDYRCQNGWIDDYSGPVNTLQAKQDNFIVAPNEDVNLLEYIQASMEGNITFCTEQTDVLSIDKANNTATIIGRGVAHVTATASDGGHTVNFTITGDTFQTELNELIQSINAIGSIDSTNYLQKLPDIVAAEQKLDAFDKNHPDQKDQVTNRQTLLDARSAYEREAQAYKQSRIDAVIAAINAIGTITKENYPTKKEPIETAERLRDALAAEYDIEILTSVTNLETLTNARNTYNQFIHPTYAWGDVNNDKDINASDALLALQHSVHLIELDGEALRVADVNGDGEVDASDALLILQYSVQLIDHFPAENQ